MKVILCALLTHLCAIAYAQDYQFEWMKQIGGTGTENAVDVESDASGNIYITGTYSQTVDFDPGTGVSERTCNGFFDVFLLKLSSTGDFLWVKTFGGTGLDASSNLETDQSGNVYIAGVFSSTVDVDPGSAVLNFTASGSTYSDMFFSKFDADGTLLWAKQLGNGNSESLIGMDINSSGLVITGKHTSNLDFDPNAGVSTVNGGFYSMFVARYDLNGNYVWAKGMGNLTDFNAGYGISQDPAGNIYVTGSFGGTVDFDPGAGTMNVTCSNGTNSSDGFVLKLDATGNLIWVKQIAGADFQTPQAIVASNTTVVLSGISEGTTDFDPGVGEANLNAGGFVAKLDANGNYVWAQLVSNNDAVSVILDDQENVFVSGFVFNSSSYYDGFLSKLSSSGSVEWNNIIGSNSSQEGVSRTVLTADGKLVTVGRFGETVDFNPGPGVYNATSNGDADVYVLVQSTCNPSFGTDEQVACGNYTWIDGITYSASTNNATYTLTNAAGCDSVVTLHLTINQPSSGIFTHTTCGQYTWMDGITYTSSNNTATYTLTNAAGCDSVVILNLTVNHPTSGTFTHTECGPYTWINGVTYTSSNNTATYTLTNVAGCDSIVTLNLTIAEPSATITENENGSLVASNGQSYQWINCADHTPVNGQTNQLFLPESNGSYAVVVSVSGCSDTSSCVLVDNLGFTDLHNSAAVTIYPNPSSDGFFSLSTDKLYDKLNLTVYSPEGKLILEETVNHEQVHPFEIPGEKGVYLVEIVTGNRMKLTLKVFKN